MIAKLKEIIETKQNCRIEFFLISGKSHIYESAEGEIYIADSYISFPDNNSDVTINAKYIECFKEL